MNDIAIKVENLSKCYQIYEKPHDRLLQMLARGRKQFYKEFWALKDVSFEVKKGETVGIIGRNGSGKSTLLQMICGTLNPTSGTIQTNGRIAALLELGSGFNPEFTGRENVYMNGAVLGLTKEEIDARFDEIATFAEIGEFIEQPVKTYSSGMMVRLAFAVAINVDPEILIVDEALSVGDELFQRKCFSRIEVIRSRGATVLFVSHSGAQVIELCDRAILLDAGEMIAVAQPKDVVSHYQKLLYAPVNTRNEVRNQIISGSWAGSSIRQETEVNEAAGTEDRIGFERRCSGGEETFDPNLIPSTTINYESHGPIIGTPEILTEDGRKVNGLIRGRRYRYCYQVAFHRAANMVRFGMSIKTTTGLSLAGALTASGLAAAIHKIDQGAAVDVEFLFECNLNPGVYFMNAGVFGINGNQECVLHRRVDVVAFRVLPVTENIETEMVCLAFEPTVRIRA